MKTYSRTPGAGRRQLFKSTGEADNEAHGSQQSPELFGPSMSAERNVAVHELPHPERKLRVQIERLSHKTIRALQTPKPKLLVGKETSPSRKRVRSSFSLVILSSSDSDIDESGYEDGSTKLFSAVNTRSAKKARLSERKTPKKTLQISPMKDSSSARRKSSFKSQDSARCDKSDDEENIAGREEASSSTKRKSIIVNEPDSDSDNSSLNKSGSSSEQTSNDVAPDSERRQTRYSRRSAVKQSEDILNRSTRLSNKAKPNYEELSDDSSDDEIVAKKRPISRQKRAASHDSSFNQSSGISTEDISSTTSKSTTDDNWSSSNKETTPVRKILHNRNLRSAGISPIQEEPPVSKNDNAQDIDRNTDEETDLMVEKISPRRPLRTSPSKRDAINGSGETTALRSIVIQAETNSAAFKSTPAKNSNIKSKPTSTSIVKDWDPLHFLQCHSKNNNKSDDKTQVWQCSFEPDSLEDGVSNCVATCGGSTVCLIECDSGIVLNRYNHPKGTEEFFTLAWTTLTLDKTKSSNTINILAVAGRLGVINLLHPDELVCYAQLTGHNQMISALAFHPNEPNILCSGDAEGVLIIWDIGIPDGVEHQTDWRQLDTLRAESDVLSIAFIPDFDYVVAGCAHSCFGWDYSANKTRLIRKKPNVEFVHPNSRHSEDEDQTIDSVVLLSKNVIATKCVGHKNIYLWNFETTISTATKKLVNGQKLDISITAILTWSDSDNAYMKMGFVTESCVLAAGDAKGKLWLYHLKKILDAKRRDNVITVVPPSITIEWPECKTNGDETNSENVVINCVALNSDASFIVSATDKNIACIWQ